ncbi:Putative SOS response-associated peptidase YedK [Eubacterium aggregans]|uniref:Abasic site processing protein n=1 Tax=Eubacterium aggregans TaxID=81409 RepID=A0A1H4B2K8_9FIRM|nr:SOS response-associated peptidase family protein [Eubacterium aggregans]SEA42284.1 Putative SOS response-associated peptidase YedK [Eubacterium aggregans]
MCSRYIFRTTIPELKTLLDDSQRHNIPIHEGDIHPKDLTLGLILQGGVKKTVLMRWGYQSTTPSGLIINARSETIQKKPIFSSDFKYRRCLLPMAGFYEWDFKKNLYLFSPKVADAYLCGIFHPVDDDFFHFVVLTRPAAGTPASVHNRMPVILPNSQTDQWLFDINAAHELLYGEPYLLEKNCLEKYEQLDFLS